MLEPRNTERAWRVFVYLFDGLERVHTVCHTL